MLVINEPLFQEDVLVFGPYNLGDLDLQGRAILTVFSDSPIAIDIQFTIDPNDKAQGPIFSTKAPPHTWRSDKITMLMDDFYIVVTQVLKGDINSKFYLSLGNPGCPSSGKKEPDHKRSKSPFARKFSTSSKPEHKDQKTHPMIDYRLPQFVPQGALLVGGKNGRLELIPKAHQPDMYLKSTNCGYEWCFIYPPIGD